MAGGPPPFATSKRWNVEDLSNIRLAGMLYATTRRNVIEADVASASGRAMWEACMATLALQLCGATQSDAEVLTLGAHIAPVTYWLSTRIRRVFAAGLDGDTEPAALQAALVAEPDRYWGLRWNPRRVLAQPMRGAFLSHDDGSLQAVVIGSDVTVDPELLDDAHRVLAPGGMLAVATIAEEGHELVIDEVLADRGWELLAPFDVYRSVATTTAGLPDLVHLTVLKPLVDPSPVPQQTRVDGSHPDALVRCLPERVVVVDGGARFGFGTQWTALAPHVQLIGFEPDSAECDRLTYEYAGRVDATLVPLGLGSVRETAPLLVTRAPGGSSRIAPNLAGTAHLTYEAGAVITNTFDVEFVPLDEWCESNAVDRVDAIKLDVEGGELDALRGALRTLRHVRVLEVEVKFCALNVGQPLYGEVAQLLQDHGFVPWRFRNLAHYHLKSVDARPRSYETLYYEGEAITISAPAAQLNWCDAIFVAEAAFTQSDLDWRQRLRDAVVFDAMALPDLVIHALQGLLAGVGVPMPVRSAAEDRLRALSAEGGR